ncbi:putative integral membrane protein [Terriglobus roseus DSM 18391]|uniref:Putative integral membrane protein n=1 Tax=Terriglobus roseus (strain DSM 18391 / NRRL B-41598 / KBS 63) TaxID=926566 RepID=I3ZJT8_TERRK|nr:TMEM175 family protein [Terriglobus roseus]AFL89506.1 putative integral membrane protein [Terriglobus roseus DSM 18391]
MKSTRLEAFSDGVIAVIITIMVLELRVPAASGLPGFLTIVPRLGIYALSFFMVAIYWVNHHELCRRNESINYRVLWANLLFLFLLSLVPFFTDYVQEKHFDSFSVAIYTVVMMSSGGAFLVLRLALNQLHQLHGEPLPKQDRAETIKHVTSIVLYLAALPIAYYKPILALLLNLLVTFIWIAPELGLHRPGRHHAPHA